MSCLIKPKTTLQHQLDLTGGMVSRFQEYWGGPESRKDPVQKKELPTDASVNFPQLYVLRAASMEGLAAFSAQSSYAPNADSPVIKYQCCRYGDPQ
jgi:hypothetical protein